MTDLRTNESEPLQAEFAAAQGWLAPAGPCVTPAGVPWQNPPAPRPVLSRPPNAAARDALSDALMATVREPVMILDRSLRVIAASRSYYKLFPTKLSAVPGQPFCGASVLRWDAAALAPLRDMLGRGSAVEDFEIEIDVPSLGRRRMLMNASRADDNDASAAAILVALEDVTARHDAGRIKEELRKEQEMALHEVHHRFANSLQIIASILLLKARTVQSEETRAHLHDVHKRLILVASVQRQLYAVGAAPEIEFGPYLQQLCEGLAKSMIGEDHAVIIVSSSTAGCIKADDAVSFGLIVTELVINALKHGFPDGRKGRITVDFAASGPDWRLSISDDGIGRSVGGAEPVHVGLGTSIVEALSRHLQAKVVIKPTGPGASTVISHTAVAKDAPK